jgi:hypothetical protein
LSSTLVTTDNLAIVTYPSNNQFVSALGVSLAITIVGQYDNGAVVDSTYTNVSVNTSITEINYGNNQPTTVQVLFKHEKCSKLSSRIAISLDVKSYCSWYI